MGNENIERERKPRPRSKSINFKFSLNKFGYSKFNFLAVTMAWVRLRASSLR